MLRRLSRRILPRGVYNALRKRYVILARFAVAREVPSGTSRLIIFLAPGINHPSGGILSIASLLRETSEMKGVHGAEAIWCTLPDDPPLFKYSWFKNHLHLHGLESILR